MRVTGGPRLARNIISDLEERIVHVLRTTDLPMSVIGQRFGISRTKVQEINKRHGTRKNSSSKKEEVGCGCSQATAFRCMGWTFGIFLLYI